MIGRRRFLEILSALGVSQAIPARADGMVLWTRLLGDFGAAAIPVRWEVAADEAMRTIRLRRRLHL